jgi:hypothetical protein
MRFHGKNERLMAKSSGAIVALALVLAIILSSGTVYAGWSNYDNFDCCSFRSNSWDVVAWYGTTVSGVSSWTKYYCEDNRGYVITYATGYGFLKLQKEKNLPCNNDLRINAFANQYHTFTKLRVRDTWHYEVTNCPNGGKCGHTSEIGIYLNTGANIWGAYGFMFDDGGMWVNPGWGGCPSIHSDDNFDFWFTWDGTTLRGWADNLVHPSESCGTASNPIVFGNLPQPSTRNFYMATQISGGYGAATIRYQAADVMEYYMPSPPSVSVINPGNVEVAYPTPSTQLTVSARVTSEASSVKCDRYIDGTKMNVPQQCTPGGNIATRKSYTKSPSPSGGYQDDGDAQLTNGVPVQTLFNGVACADVGWQNINPTITIDLATTTSINKVRIYLGGGGAGGITAPSQIKVYTSGNNVDWNLVATKTGIPNANGWVDITFAAASARYAKLEVTRGGEWTMLCETEVYETCAPAPIIVNTAGGTATVSYTDTYSVSSHNFRFECTDFMGQTGSNTAYFSVISVDRVAPTVSMRSYPASAKTLPITAKILASDNDQQPLNCRFSEPTGKISPGTFTCQNGAECSFNVGTGATPPGGTYTINVTCEDSNKNNASTSFQFKFDSSAPTVALSSPLNSININVNIINFTFTATDNDPMNCSLNIKPVGLAALPSVKINNVQSGVQQTTSQTPSLSSGYNHQWNISCTDLVGNVGTSETRTFNYAMPQDTISLTDPADGFRTSGSSQVFTFSHNFIRKLWFITLLPTCGLNINGVQVATLKDVPAGTQQTFSYDKLPEGTNKWFVNCSIYLFLLVSASKSSDTRNLIVDMSAPSVSLDIPADGNVVSIPFPKNEQDITFRYSVTDTQATSFTCSLWLSTPQSTTMNSVETKYSLAPGVNTFTRTLGPGTYYWKIKCNDGFYEASAPASGSRMLKIKIIDVNAPVITLVSPDNNAVIKTDFTFQFRVTDDMSSIVSCSLILKGRPEPMKSYNTGSGYLWPIPPPPGISGKIRWQINCTDTSGNIGYSEERNVTADRPPRILNFTPVTETYLNNTNVIFKLTVWDDIDPTLRCVITIDGTAKPAITAPNSQEMQVSYTLLAGRHTSKLQCWDSTGSTVEDPVVYVDLTPPSLTISSPANDLITCNTFTKFAFSVSDDLSKNVTCKLVLGSATTWNEIIDLSAAGGTAVQKLITPSQALSTGKKEWYIQCTDLAGNVNTSAKRNITIAGTDPDNFKINFIPPTLPSGWYTIYDKLVVNVTAGKNLSEAWLELNGTTYALTMGATKKNWYISTTGGMQSGINTYRVYGRGEDYGCLTYSENTIKYRPEYAIPENRPFILTLAEFQEPAIWTAAVLAIAALMLGIAYMLSKVFVLPEWEAFAKDEFGQLIFSAFLFVMFVLISGIIEEGSDSLANDILMKTAAAGENVTYWSYNSQTGSWSTSNDYRCNYPCHIYLARGFLGTTYESYKNTFKEVSKAYVVSKLYESVAIGNTAEIVPAFSKFDLQFSIPMYAGRAIYDNSLEVAIKDLSRAMAVIKAQEVALAYAVNLAFAFFIGGLVLRVLWFTRKFGGLLMALAIGLYVFLPFIYVLGWYTVDKTGITFDFQDPQMVSGAGQLGDAFLGETDISALFSTYNTDGRETSMGLLDVTGRAYIAAIFIPALAILTVIGFVRHFSPMIGGDPEIAGLSRLI